MPCEKTFRKRVIIITPLSLDNCNHIINTDPRHFCLDIPTDAHIYGIA